MTRRARAGHTAGFREEAGPRSNQALAALVLAVGAAVWEDVVHRAVRGGQESVRTGGDLWLHAALLVPIAFVALAVGSRVVRRFGREGRARRDLHALTVAGAFTALMVPAALAHAPVHDLLGSSLADKSLSPGAQAHASAHGSVLAHALGDALWAFPAVLLVTFVATRVAWPRLRFSSLQWAGAGAVLVLLASSSVIGVSSEAAGSPPVARFTQPLPIPPTVSGSEIELTAARTPVQVFPSGPPTMMWTYNGTFPGPTIEATSGVHQEVVLTNDLPASAGPLTMHHHGEHAASAFDGQPHEFLVETGEQYRYEFDYLDGGEGEPGRLQWYHDHTMDVTGRNVWQGLAGMVMLRDPADAEIDAALPSGDRDVPLMIVDRTFDADHQLNYTFNNEGTLGDRLLVNGAIQPYLDVADVKYRLRILNASNARFYELALSNGQPITMVGNEGGLLPEPVTLDSVVLGPAERAEIIVDFSGELGKHVVLRNLIGVGSSLNAVMEFRVTRDEADMSTVPATLRPAPVADGPALVNRTWVFGQDATSGEWTINGHGFDPDIVDAHPKRGVKERWVFVNATNVDHIVHVHNTTFPITSRVRPGTDTSGLLGETGLQESFQLRPNETVTMEVQFRDHLGRYILHCHLLEHEDHAMMTQFEVVP